MSAPLKKETVAFPTDRDRLLPRDIEAEQALLAGWLSGDTAAMELVDPNDFYKTKHQVLVQALKEMVAEGRGIDIVTASGYLGDRGLLEKVGGASRLSKLLSECPMAPNPTEYAKRVSQLADARRLVEACRQAEKQCLDSPHEAAKAIEDLRNIEVQASRGKVPTIGELAISDEEWEGSELTPRCIVEDFLYADVAVMAGPGGTGKTTLSLYEAIHIALKCRLYGLEVVNPGHVLFITAEDSRARLVARLRQITTAMQLTPEEVGTVRRNILFWDVSGEDIKLITQSDGNIRLSTVVDDIVAAHKGNPPALIIIDPIVSFGIGESKVNDNEQGLINAGRRLRNGLDCAVRFIHHTGQAAAREKTLDQYAARGGSALPDGSRMCFILQSWGPGHNSNPPEGCQPDPDASIIILARAKLSYSRPNLPLIWIKRTGWTFEHFTEVAISDEERDRAVRAQILRFLTEAEIRGAYYNKTELDSAFKELGLTRKVVRDTRNLLIAEGLIVEQDLPKELQRTKRKTYLSTRRDSAGFHQDSETSSGNSATKTQINNAAAYRKRNGGRISRPFSSSLPNSAGDTRRDSAGLAGLDETTHQGAPEVDGEHHHLDSDEVNL